MKLTELIRRLGGTRPPGPVVEDAAVRREWDRLRAGASSTAERAEIDAVFARVVR